MDKEKKLTMENMSPAVQKILKKIKEIKE